MSLDEFDATAVEASTPKSVDTRTFARIIAQDYGGNLLAFCKKFNFSDGTRSRLSALMHGDRSAEISQSLIAGVAAAVHADAETLFPSGQLLHKSSVALQETPAFAAIAEKHAIRFRGHSKDSLAALLVALGLKTTDVNRFRNIVSRNFGTATNAKFCNHVASLLNIPVDVLFPEEIYGSLTRERKPGAAYKAHDDVQQEGVAAPAPVSESINVS